MSRVIGSSFLLLVAQMCVGLNAPAETRTTNIIDGVARDAGGNFVLGDTGPLNVLLITNGGSLINSTGIVGRTLPASFNQAVVAGPNSVWINTNDFVLGAVGGQNQVQVRDGGRLTVEWLGIVGRDALSSGNVLQVSGAGSVLDLAALTVGQGGADNRVVVEDGARAGRGITGDVLVNIGDQPGSDHNALEVSGAGTTWFTDGFRVGREGSYNRAILSAGARLTNDFLIVGREIASMGNLARIAGAGTVWVVRPDRAVSTVIGLHGSSNRLEVLGGAQFETANLTLAASNAAALNSAQIAGPGTIGRATGTVAIGDVGSHNFFEVIAGGYLKAGTVYVGNGGADNQMVVRDARVANSGSLWMGSGSSSFRNTLVLDGSGTAWTNGSRVTLGGGGAQNRLTVSGGAQFLQSPRGLVGFNVGSAANAVGNELWITGVGSAVRGRWALYVGTAGSSNRLTLVDGAFLETDSAALGWECRSHDNIARVVGAGTVWSNANLLEIGFCSTNNQLVVSNGAQVFAGHVRSGVQGGSSNSIVVAGPGSLLSAGADLFVGNSGRDQTLRLVDGARVVGRFDRVGFGGVGSRATVAGAGTSWSNVSLTVGESGGARENRIELSEGAQLQSGTGTIGQAMGADTNQVVLSGVGTRWLVGSNLFVGRAGGGNRLEIKDGAQVSDQHGVLGLSSGSRGSVAFVSGPGSTWKNSGNLLVGSNGLGAQLTVVHGGRVSSAAATVGVDGPLVGTGAACQARVGSNDVLVAGAGSVLEVGGPLVVGSRTIGNTVTVRDGGAIFATGLLIGASNAFEPSFPCGSISLINRVSVEQGSLVVTNSTADATMELRYGHLEVDGGLVTADRLIVTNNGFVSVASGTLRVREGTVVSSPSSRIQIGDGTRTANLTLLGGVLDLEGSFNLSSLATLNGDGVIRATLKSIAGVIAPGRPGHPGRVSLQGGLVAMEGPGAALAIDIQGTTAGVTYDQVELDDAAVAARLDVRLQGGFVPSPTDTFTVLRFQRWTDESFISNRRADRRVLTVDRLGSFACGFSGAGLVLSDYRSTDLDGDGIEDAWALLHFGHSPLTAEELAADLDGDGASNAAEFAASTNPTDATSVLRLRPTYYGSFAVEFDPVPGRTYQLWASEDLQTWQEILDPILEHVADMYSLQEPLQNNARRARFYRLKVE